jgi:hypothetical protein
MSKVYEITIWKPKTGKWADAKKNMQEVAAIFKNAGVSDVQILEGSIGKDVGNLIMIQTYKGLADNGALNEKLGEDSAFQNWMKEHGKDDYATLVSHDLYIES